MKKRYAIVDVGSNTMVLVIYDVENGSFERTYHISTPAHLIDYVDNNIMAAAGLKVAKETLSTYEQIAIKQQADYFYGFITEPCRIDNVNDLKEALSHTRFEIEALSGEDEAKYDFAGALVSYPDLSDGIAFDVGGGSTEIISFKNKKLQDAYSFPLGCVRLAHYPLDSDVCKNALDDAKNQFPSFQVISKELIGIGGTMRAVGLMMHDIYQTDKTIQVSDINDLYTRLCNQEEVAISAMHNNVKKSRWPLILPGMHMILEIINAFQAEHIKISPTNIREGYLLKYIKK